MKLFKKILVTVFFTLSLSAAAIAEDDLVVMQKMADAFGLISIEETKAIALETKPGVVDEIELDSIGNGGGWKYEVELYDEQGREWEIDIHAKTGQIIKVKIGD